MRGLFHKGLFVRVESLESHEERTNNRRPSTNLEGSNQGLTQSKIREQILDELKKAVGEEETQGSWRVKGRW